METNDIRIIGLDIDGCIYNKFYREYVINMKIGAIQDPNEQMRQFNEAVIQHNREFFDNLILGNANFKQVIVTLATNRQSNYVDLNNDKPSCYPIIRVICDYLSQGVNKVQLETMLLGDIYGKLALGTSYTKAIEDTTDYVIDGAVDEEQIKIHHSSWRFDETKVTILYAQIHKIANENLGNIIYDFYDDRLDVLQYIQKFYNKFPELFPKNVTVRLHQYAGEGVEEVAVIKGTGFIDRNFGETVIDMAKLAATSDTDGYNNRLYVGTNLLKKFPEQQALLSQLKQRQLVEPQVKASQLSIEEGLIPVKASQPSIEEKGLITAFILRMIAKYKKIYGTEYSSYDVPSTELKNREKDFVVGESKKTNEGTLS